MQTLDKFINLAGSGGIEVQFYQHQGGSAYRARGDRTLHLLTRFVEGEKQTHVYLVLEGVVAMYKLLSLGRKSAAESEIEILKLAMLEAIAEGNDLRLLE